MRGRLKRHERLNEEVTKMDGQLTPEENESPEQFKVRVNRAIKERKKNPPNAPEPIKKTIEQVLDGSSSNSAQPASSEPKPDEETKPAPIANNGQAESQQSAPTPVDKREVEIREWA